MRITEGEAGANAPFQVELVERSVAHVRSVSGDAENQAFPAVARISALNQSIYDLAVAPVVRRIATPQVAEAKRQMHPLRLRRTLVSDLNPAMLAVGSALAQPCRRRTER